MRILVTNDDGVHAPGIKVLTDIARTMTDDVWVVAPESQQSGAGHSLTLHRPLRIQEYGATRYGVSGTPTDSVLMAIRVVMDCPPDLILSGINHGSNLADSVTYSGTVSAALEGALFGVPSIAISQDVQFGGMDPEWSTARTFLPDILPRLYKMAWHPGLFINVNLPDCSCEHVTGVIVAPQGNHVPTDDIEKRIDLRGIPYYWIGHAQEPTKKSYLTDAAVVENRGISVTSLRTDMTNHQHLHHLATILSER